MAVGTSGLNAHEIDALILKEVSAANNEESSLQVLIVDADHKRTASIAEVILSEGHLVNKSHDLSLALKLSEILKPHLILISASLISQIGIEIYHEFHKTLVGTNATIVATGWGLEQQVALDKLDFDYWLADPASPMVLREILVASTH